MPSQISLPFTWKWLLRALHHVSEVSRVCGLQTPQCPLELAPPPACAPLPRPCPCTSTRAWVMPWMCVFLAWGSVAGVGSIRPAQPTPCRWPRNRCGSQTRWPTCGSCRSCRCIWPTLAASRSSGGRFWVRVRAPGKGGGELGTRPVCACRVSISLSILSSPLGTPYTALPHCPGRAESHSGSEGDLLPRPSGTCPHCPGATCEMQGGIGGPLDQPRSSPAGSMSWISCRGVSSGLDALLDDFALCTPHVDCAEVALVHGALQLCRPAAELRGLGEPDLGVPARAAPRVRGEPGPQEQPARGYNPPPCRATSGQQRARCTAGLALSPGIWRVGQSPE